MMCRFWCSDCQHYYSSLVSARSSLGFDSDCFFCKTSLIFPQAERKIGAFSNLDSVPEAKRRCSA